MFKLQMFLHPFNSLLSCHHLKKKRVIGEVLKEIKAEMDKKRVGKLLQHFNNKRLKKTSLVSVPNKIYIYIYIY
jgi:hypothetical protein